MSYLSYTDGVILLLDKKSINCKNGLPDINGWLLIYRGRQPK